jgi:hypothetical protein
VISVEPSVPAFTESIKMDVVSVFHERLCSLKGKENLYWHSNRYLLIELSLIGKYILIFTFICISIGHVQSCDMKAVAFNKVNI